MAKNITPQDDFDGFRLDFSDAALKSAPRISTGFPQLDGLIRGGLGPELTVLGAISSLGKSTFALQIAQNISARNIPVLYFSLEMSKQSIAMKMSSRIAFEMVRKEEKDYSKCRKKALSSYELSNAEMLDPQKAELRREAMKKCTEDTSCLYIIERDAKHQSFSGKSITETVKAFISAKKVKPVVFVDYLQILSASDNSMYKNERQIVDENIAALWLLSKQLELSVFVISSVNRESYNKRISFNSFKESGAIEFTSDVVLGMQFAKIGELNDDQLKSFNASAEKSKDPRSLQVIVLKQRYGKCGDDVCSIYDYYPSYSCFEELPSPAGAAAGSGSGKKAASGSGSEKKGARGSGKSKQAKGGIDL